MDCFAFTAAQHCHWRGQDERLESSDLGSSHTRSTSSTVDSEEFNESIDRLLLKSVVIWSRALFRSHLSFSIII